MDTSNAERAGDADALALAARELVREALGRAVAQAHHVQQVGHDAAGLGFACRQLVKADGLGHDVQHAHAGVQRRERILEDHLDLAPERVEVLFALERGQVCAAERDGTFRGRVQPLDQPRHGGFAGTRFADQADDFAAAHGKVDAVDRQIRAGLGMECSAQSAHIKKNVAHARRGSRLSSRRSPTMLMERISTSRAMPGNRLIQ
ncbi:hypothetical protein G6F58_012743 [Rhizopus delemar]|nr:hypothetical protein G6F58_012743 [Rhizopus delemar]